MSYDNKIDCFSLGIVLFEMLTNALPFDFSNKKIYVDQIINQNINFEEFPILKTVSKEAKDLLR